MSVIRSDSDKEIKCLHRVRYVRHESDAFRAASQLRRFCNRMRSEIPDAVRAASQLRKFSETLRPLPDLSPTRKSSVLTEIDTARETGKRFRSPPLAMTFDRSNFCWLLLVTHFLSSRFRTATDFLSAARYLRGEVMISRPSLTRCVTRPSGSICPGTGEADLRSCDALRAPLGPYVRGKGERPIPAL